MNPTSKLLMALGLFLFLLFCNQCKPDSLSAENTMAKNIIAPDFSLNDFSVSMVQDWLEIKWKTKKEAGVKGFEIQSSEDKVNYKTLKWESAFGSKNGAEYLIINDIKTFESSLFFRIKTIFENGNFALSKIEKIKTPSKAKFERIQLKLQEN